jgi:DUF3108-like
VASEKRCLMRSGLAIGIACSFTIGASLAAPALKDPDGGLYYPTRPGAKWVYDNEGEEYTHVVTRVEDVDGAKVVSVARAVGDRVIPVRTVTVSDKGLFQPEDAGEKLDPPFCYLKLPAKAGDTWEANGVHQGKTFLRGTRTVAGVEDVEVPAGKFKCVRVEWTCTLNAGRKYTVTVWYAPGVGEVKSAMDGKDTTLLKSFTPGKK